MLKMQLLAHASIREQLKRFLYERGVLEVTDVSLEETESAFSEDDVRETHELLEATRESLEFLDQYSAKISFLDRLKRGPLAASYEDGERLSGEIDVREVWRKCSELQAVLRNNRDSIARYRELGRSLEPWISSGVSLESLSTDDYEVQFWILPEKQADEWIEGAHQRHPIIHFEECMRERARSYCAVIMPKKNSDTLAEELKELGGFRAVFDRLQGTPAGAIEHLGIESAKLMDEISKAQDDAAELAALREKLLILSDHYNERLGLLELERRLHRTDHVFVVEGWIPAIGRRRFTDALNKRFSDIEIAFREPLDGEEPPILLENRSGIQPYEFVTTLYGRPVYRELDPTPLLAPFFLLFFAMCLTDAGYGLTLSALCGIILLRLKPSGGGGLLMRLMFMGGIATAIVGFVTGGVFGIDPQNFPSAVRQFILINPLEQPMTMLNIAFFMGVVHILFGMGIRMFANLRAGLAADAIFDDLFWILFLIALAPLGFSGILGGEVPPEILNWSKRISLVVAACIFLTGGRKAKGIVGKFFKGLLKFYDIVGYFGDVLSYARLLALGLATSAIALAINGIAAMVKGLPFYTGYIAFVLVLIVGHAFNLAVNTLGAFVHSGRLQYLEFFSKFFTGGGREFRPYKSERKYTVARELERKT
jgi:V/A-type H+-transporting ATPase subunit I